MQNVLTICLNHIQTELEAKRRNISVVTLEPSSLSTIDVMIKFKINVKMITSQVLLFPNNFIQVLVI